MTATPTYTPAVTAALISAAKRNTRQLTGKFERYTANCTGRTAGTILRTPGDRLAIGATWSAELTDHGFAEGMRLWAAADPKAHAAAVAQREADAETARAECERIDAEHAATRAAQKAEYAAQEARHRAATAALSLEITTNPSHPLSDALTAQGDGMTDAQVDAWARSTSRGESNSAETLRPLTPQMRSLVCREARTRVNVSPGWNYSGAVAQAAQDVLSGRTPCLDTSRQLMAYDPTGHKAAHAAATGRGWAGFTADAMAAATTTTGVPCGFGAGCEFNGGTAAEYVWQGDTLCSYHFPYDAHTPAATSARTVFANRHA